MALRHCVHKCETKYFQTVKKGRSVFFLKDEIRVKRIGAPEDADARLSLMGAIFFCLFCRGSVWGALCFLFFTLRCVCVCVCVCVWVCVGVLQEVSALVKGLGIGRPPLLSKAYGMQVILYTYTYRYRLYYIDIDIGYII